MLKVNYINVIIPQQIDFNMLKISDEQEKQIILQKLCDTSINMPIIIDDKVVGVIEKSKISKTGIGVISGGKIWCNVEQEIIKDIDGNFKFGAIVLKERK